MPIPIDNTRLPVDIEQGAAGGPRFNTVIAPLDNGYEQAQINWSAPRRKWDISYGVQTRAAYETIIKFFHARRGRARGFLFKDWSDFKVQSTQIGTGDGTNKDFQIIKIYDDSILPFTRNITRPIASTLTVQVNGITTTSYTLLSGGIIRFLSAPAAAAVVSVLYCEFDIPVRFDTDALVVKLGWSEVGAIPSLPVIELRDG